MNKQKYLVLMGNSTEEMDLSNEEIKVIENYGKCISEEYVMITCGDGQVIPSYQIDDYKLIK